MIMRPEITALLIQLVVFLMWSNSKRIEKYKAKAFSYVQYLVLLTALMIAGLPYICLLTNDMEAFIIRFSAKLYIALLLWALYAAAMYILAHLTSEKEHREISFPLASIPLVESLTIIIFDISIRTVNDGIVFEGSARFLLCVFEIVSIIIVAVILMKYSRAVRPWLLFTGVAFTALVAGAVILQLSAGFAFLPATALALFTAVVYALFENPFGSLDDAYGCYNAESISEGLQSCFDMGKDAFAVYVAMKSSIADKKAERDIDCLREEILKELKSVPEADVFLTLEKDIFVICKATELFDDFVLDISEVIKENKSKLEYQYDINTALVYANDLLSFETPQLLYKQLLLTKTAALNSPNTYVEICVSKEDVERTENREETKKLILDALDEDRLTIYYQPIYSSASESFDSAEALMRIVTKDGNIVMPGRFIQTAEDTGLILQMGERVLEKVCEMLTMPDMQETRLNSVDINLSLTQFDDPGLAGKYIEIARRYKVDPSRISFEISESGYQRSHENMLDNIAELAEYGFRFALDDFGSSTTNLNNLNNLPVARAKLDRFAIWKYFEDEAEKKLIQSIIGICHKLDIAVVATGIETLSQLNEMVDCNVDYIQGYYFFKPMSFDEFKHFLKPSVFEMDNTKLSIMKSNKEIRIDKSQN